MKEQLELPEVPRKRAVLRDLNGDVMPPYKRRVLIITEPESDQHLTHLRKVFTAHGYATDLMTQVEAIEDVVNAVASGIPSTDLSGPRSGHPDCVIAGVPCTFTAWMKPADPAPVVEGWYELGLADCVANMHNYWYSKSLDSFLAPLNSPHLFAHKRVDVEWRGLTTSAGVGHSTRADPWKDPRIAAAQNWPPRTPRRVLTGV